MGLYIVLIGGIFYDGDYRTLNLKLRRLRRPECRFNLKILAPPAPEYRFYLKFERAPRAPEY